MLHRMVKLLALVLGCLAGLPSLAAEVERLSGSGTLMRAFVPAPLKAGAPLRDGDEVSVDPGSEALVRINRKVAFVLRPGSSMVVSTLTDSSMSVRLARGAIRYVNGLAAPHDFHVHTQQVALGVRGTDFDIVVVDVPNRDRPVGTYVTVRHGAVDVTDTASGSVATIADSGSVYARAATQDAGAVVAMASPPNSRRSIARAGAAPDSRMAGMMVLRGQLSDRMWRVETVPFGRGEFDKDLDDLR